MGPRCARASALLVLVFCGCAVEPNIDAEPPSPSTATPQPSPPSTAEPEPAGRIEPARDGATLPGAVSLEWRADGSLLLVTHDGGGSLVPIGEGPIARLSTPPGQPTAVSFGAIVALGHDDGHVRTFDASGRALADLGPPFDLGGAAPRAVTTSADGSRIAVSFATEEQPLSERPRLHVWPDGAKLADAPEGVIVRRIALSSDGRRLVAAGIGAVTWDLRSGRVVRTYATFFDGVFGDAVPSPDGAWMAEEGGQGHTVDVWPLGAPRNKKHIADADGCQAHLVDVRFSRDGKVLVVGGQDGSWRSYAAGTWKRIAAFHPKVASSWGEMSDDGRAVLEIHDPDDGDTAIAEVWDASANRRLAELAPRAAKYAISPDARFVVGSSVDALHIWDARDGRIVRRVPIVAP